MRGGEALRSEVRRWLAAHWHNDLPPRTDNFGRDPRSAWLSRVVEAGWAVPRWPERWFGRDLDDAHARIVEEEFAAAGAPGAGQDRTNLWANTLRDFGHGAFRDAMVPKMLTGELGMCLLYSEPAAGSDLAAVRTRAERRGDEFVVTGQKIWTSGAHKADFGMLLARTDWEAPKHRGLSFFVLPMKQSGVQVRPIRQINGGTHFNEVFLDGAVVPAANMLGEYNGGWKVLQKALGYERSLMGAVARGTRAHAAARDDAILQHARAAGRLRDPVMRQRVAQVTAYRMLNRLNAQRGQIEAGQSDASRLASLGKLAMSRVLHEEARLRAELLGPASLLDGPDLPEAADANFLLLDAYFTSIGGGTDQIQRTIIGERMLGLPREPEIDRDVPFREVKMGV